MSYCCDMVLCCQPSEGLTEKHQWNKVACAALAHFHLAGADTSKIEAVGLMSFVAHGSRTAGMGKGGRRPLHGSAHRGRKGPVRSGAERDLGSGRNAAQERCAMNLSRNRLFFITPARPSFCYSATTREFLIQLLLVINNAISCYVTIQKLHYLNFKHLCNGTVVCSQIVSDVSRPTSVLLYSEIFVRTMPGAAGRHFG
jgi:hypothetical protein